MPSSSSNKLSELVHEILLKKKVAQSHCETGKLRKVVVSCTKKRAKKSVSSTQKKMLSDRKAYIAALVASAQASVKRSKMSAKKSKKTSKKAKKTSRK